MGISDDRLMRPQDEIVVQYFGTSEEVTSDKKVLMVEEYNEVLRARKVSLTQERTLLIMWHLPVTMPFITMKSLIKFPKYYPISRYELGLGRNPGCTDVRNMIIIRLPGNRIEAREA
eukprot:scaffold50874_cov35-Prasinocladus_malaysianus.AAC.1